MKSFFPGLILLLIAGYTSVNAQVTIRGTVRSNRSKPLFGASISLRDTYDGATSDSLGRFSFTTTEKVNRR